MRRVSISSAWSVLLWRSTCDFEVDIQDPIDAERWANGQSKMNVYKTETNDGIRAQEHVPRKGRLLPGSMLVHPYRKADVLPVDG